MNDPRAEHPLLAPRQHEIDDRHDAPLYGLIEP
jgi:hypothetical protein